MAADPETLRPSLERLGELAQAAGRSDLQLLVMTQLPLEEPARARERLAAWSELGATGLVIGLRYADGDGFQRALASLTPLLA